MLKAANELTHALKHPEENIPFEYGGDENIKDLQKLADIFQLRINKE